MTVRVVLMATVAVFVSVPALAALKVTNMSYEPKTVIFESAGSAVEHVIAPRRSTFISGIDGKLSLKGATLTAADKRILGTRSAVFGLTEPRTHAVPASQMDEFVIWPDGRLLFQKRTTGGRNSR